MKVELHTKAVVAHTQNVEIKPFSADYAPAVAAMCDAEGWDSWKDVKAVERALSASGVTTLVAVEDGDVLGAAQILSDGEINWILATLIVAREHRGRGIGTKLVEEAFVQAGARRLDLLTEDEGPRFYRRLEGREMKGFRLYPASSDPRRP